VLRKGVRTGRELSAGDVDHVGEKCGYCIDSLGARHCGSTIQISSTSSRKDRNVAQPAGNVKWKCNVHCNVVMGFQA
jgi:hypothetical protein